jgi:TldD protein
MQDWANWAIDTAKQRGATYADARVMDIRQRDLSTKNGEIGTLAESESLGIGIRVVASGAWGFASTDRLTRDGIETCAAQAVSIARASALAKIKNVQMAPVQSLRGYLAESLHQGSVSVFRIERQLDLLLAADKRNVAK